ncbi:unnamed protein product [Diabrotica balteata]|uniref:Uncharacterized protein n=1 Tax=Diabrotica balteata TaxID=107213 RepID=A0A9N9SZ80_DIABA|nr:unnamed protein product [Diabrotica balteata]
MSYTESDKREAKQFVEFYIDNIENHSNYFQYYLSEDVVLDWFGKTIKKEKNVTAFLKDQMGSVNHFLSDAVPVGKIGFRDTHIIKVPRTQKMIPLALMSPPRPIQLRSETTTPKKRPLPSSSNNNRRELRSKYPKEQGQGDGPHNNTEIPSSPRKKLKTPYEVSLESIETLENECDSTESGQKLKYVLCQGDIEFHRPSQKKYQSETKWRRPCKLSVAYTSLGSNQYTIYLIIYEGNVKCRRNLMKEFDAVDAEESEI